MWGALNAAIGIFHAGSVMPAAGPAASTTAPTWQALFAARRARPQLVHAAALPAVPAAAVELLPEDQWRAPSAPPKPAAPAAEPGSSSEAAGDGAEGEEGAEGAHIAQVRKRCRPEGQRGRQWPARLTGSSGGV